VGSYVPGSVALLLECSSAPGDALVVYVTARWPVELIEDRDRWIPRSKDEPLVEIAARTAVRAGEVWRREGHPGGIPNQVEPHDRERRPAGQAREACAAVASSRPAERLSVTHVRESVAGRSLTEGCVLHVPGGWEHHMTAFCRPPARQERDEEQQEEQEEEQEEGGTGTWPWETTRACGRPEHSGYYTLQISRGTYLEDPPDPAPLDRLPASFADQSASRHACR
jgi:hypothetical protein